MDTRTRTYSVPQELADKRLDVVLTELLRAEPLDDLGFESPSRAQVGRWIDDGIVSVGSSVCRKVSTRVSAAAEITVLLPEPEPTHLVADTDVKFGVLFEDEHLIVVNKPSAATVHPGSGQRSGTLANALVAYLGEGLHRIGGALRPGIVHRLDRDTTGAMVVAKSEVAYHGLQLQFRPPRTIRREYLALVLKWPRPVAGLQFLTDQSGVIELPIMRHLVDRTRMMAVTPEGLGAKSPQAEHEAREASTYFQLEEALPQALILRLRLETGRTHQIRVHLAACRAPILGDPIYGPALADLSPHLRMVTKHLGRQALHAERLAFRHPVTGEDLTFEAPVPEDFAAAIKACRA